MKRFLAMILSFIMVTAMFPALAEEASPAEGIQDIQLDELFSELGSWFSDAAGEIGEAAEEAGSSIQTEIETKMDELNGWIEDTAEDAGEAAEEAGSRIETQVKEWLNLFGGWLNDTAEDVQKAAEEVSGWAEEKWTAVRGTAQDAAEWIKSKSAEWGESAQSAAQGAMQWAESYWKFLISTFSEKSASLKNRMSELWDSMKDGIRRLYESLTEYWSGLKNDTAAYGEIISGVTNIAIREGLQEYAALAEELAAGQEAEIPADVQAQLDVMKQYGTDETETDMKLDGEIVEAWLTGLGISKDDFEAQFKERFEKKLTRLSIQAESAAMNEYISQHGLAFSSAARRAQDRLDRYAAGTLDLTEGQFNQAKEIIEAWSREAGIDEKELVRIFMDNMETTAP